MNRQSRFCSLADVRKSRNEEAKRGERPETPPPGYATECWGTSNRFAHYPDNKLTRKALARINSARHERGYDPLSPLAVLYNLCPVPEERHTLRAQRLFNRSVVLA